MSSSARYGKQYTVPEGATTILKDFTRELLRHQPEDEHYFAFGLDYFNGLLEQEERRGGVGHLSKEELEEVLAEMFIQADADGSGALSLTEFKSVLKNANLGLSDKDAKLLYAEADMDENGEVTYQEFIPLAVDLVQSMYARMEAADAAAEEEEEARDLAAEQLHGMGREELNKVMADIFKRADADGSGALSLQEFRKCLKDADIGLTKKEINILMAECDVDQDGTISYDEFIPVAFDILVEIVKGQVLEQRSPSELETFLIAIWERMDGERMGRLPVSALSQALRTADLGLNKIQVHSVVGEAPVEEDGCADYYSFAPKAAIIVGRLLDRAAQAERADAVQHLDQQTLGFDLGQMESALLGAFEAQDPSGSQFVSEDMVLQVLTSADLPMQLGPVETNALMSCIVVEDEGVFYPELCQIAPHVLQYLAENAAIY